MMTKSQALQWAREQDPDGIGVDEDEMAEAFRAIYGHYPDEDEEATGVYSLICSHLPDGEMT